MPSECIELLNEKELELFSSIYNNTELKSESKWHEIVNHILTPKHDFILHKELFKLIYHNNEIKSAWSPSEESINNTNIKKSMNELSFSTYEEFYYWSVGTETRYDFWRHAIDKINIKFDTPPSDIFDVHMGIPLTTYLPDAKLNIAASCFNKRLPSDNAIVYSSENDPNLVKTITFDKLQRLSNQVSNSLVNKLGLVPGDAVGICMPMTAETIAIYLGIVQAGCAVVSIADSFSTAEIETRIRLSDAKLVFTQDVIYRGTKFLPLLGRVIQANPERTVVLSGLLPDVSQDEIVQLHASTDSIRRGLDAFGDMIDWEWFNFLESSSEEFENISVPAMNPCNILFSSGTTGEPKAIVWSHATPLKCAIDGYFHQDIRIGETIAWPTNIGWMMGPWLLFQMINGATIALFNGVTVGEPFCKFIENSKTSMLGVIPSLVKSWKANNATKNCDWSAIRRYSSTGEASDQISMLWLMSRVQGYSPVIEYCGGTEIGGSYLSSTLVQHNAPAMFSSPVLGSNIMILDNNNNEIPESGAGEVTLIPPCIGLSTKLLNRDHYECYFEDMPSGPNNEILRKHGDEIELISSKKLSYTNIPEKFLPYHRALGRCDDTMNLGGIKISSVEIERVCNLTTGVHETAAIGVTPNGGGPSYLVLYVVLIPGAKDDLTLKLDYVSLKGQLQGKIKALLNPLFHIGDIVITDILPRTASNKIMRRVLRDQYMLLEQAK